MIGNLNDWQIVELKEKENEVFQFEINLINEDALTSVETAQELTIKKGGMGAVMRNYKDAEKVEGDDFPVVEWTSDPLALEQHCQLADSELIHEPGTVYAKCKIWPKVRTDPYLKESWFQPPSAAAPEMHIIWIRNVLMGDIDFVVAHEEESEAEAPTAPPPSVLFPHNRSKAGDCIRIPGVERTLITLKKDQRKKFEMVEIEGEAGVRKLKQKLKEKKQKKAEVSEAKKKQLRLEGLLNKNYKTSDEAPIAR